ncbi:hypothetical protein VHEMI10052 [[Torrubiella] hemipterigena]|nr:hypothetical protein VHEMI10052 [[Torrubiella] hemipterigena]
MQTSPVVLKSTKEFLINCPSDAYLIATQPGLSAADFRSSKAWAMPFLHQTATKDKRIKGRYVVSEVIGKLPEFDMVEFVRSACKKAGKHVTIAELALQPLSSGDRAQRLAANDKTLAAKLNEMTNEKSFTILMMSPPGEPTYEPEFNAALRVAQKRAAEKSVAEKPTTSAAATSTATAVPVKLPLFEKYQFFTPALFMGFLAAAFMMMIVTVGIKGLMSLEVSYGAFEKEMGPAAQKKQQ